MEKIKKFLKDQPPARLIAASFFLTILLGTVLLKLPISVKKGVDVSWIDSLFTSTSAVCVTGLIAVDCADHFTAFGQGVLAVLIQIGGLGVSSIGVGLVLAARKKVGIKSRGIVKEALNTDNYKGIVRLVRAVLITTLGFEIAGAVLSFLVFVKDFKPLHALGISIFHSVAAFNNSGFDILGGLRNLTPYYNDLLLNLVTIALIIFGGIGFLVIMDVAKNKRFRKLSLHSKIVITTSAGLIVVGTLLLKATEKITWLEALFQSVSTRTAGFSTCAIGNFTNAGLFVMCILMFIGASPGSTGGGIKTSTAFVVLQELRSQCTKKTVHAFHRSISRQNVSKAFMITILSGMVVCVATFILCALEPEYSFMQILFEVVSAFGTVGLSTGITPELGAAGKLLIILVMYTGRVGAFTLLSMWVNRLEPKARYSEETVAIG